MSEKNGLIVTPRKPGVRKRVTFQTVGPSMTKQAHKDECDLNRIMARAKKGQAVAFRTRYDGQVGDFLDIPADFHGAMNAVARAQEAFMELPSDVRKRFGNDPEAFFTFANDPANIGEMRKMGLAPPVRPVQAPPEPEPEPEPPAE